MANYLLQEDGASKFVLESGSGDLLIEGTPVEATFAGTSSLSATVHRFPYIKPTLAGTSSLTATISLPGSSRTFSTPGTWFWTCPPGVTTVDVQAYGGGCGGLSSLGGGSNIGGGGGAYASRVAVPVTPGTTYTVVVGAAGASNGGHGGNSTFTGDSSVHVIAAGSVSRTGGLVASSTGDAGHVFAGGDGGNFLAGQTNNGGAGGGASGNPAAAGANGTDAQSNGNPGQPGGAGANGGGHGGRGGDSSTDSGLNTGLSAPGGGGGGGGAGGAAGGPGAGGRVVISVQVFTASLTGTSTLAAALRVHRSIRPTLRGTSTLTFRVSNPYIHPLLHGSSTLTARVGSPIIRPTIRGTSTLVAVISHLAVHVSQVSADVLATNTAVPARVTQVTLEVLHPRKYGLHVWHRT